MAVRLRGNPFARTLKSKDGARPAILSVVGHHMQLPYPAALPSWTKNSHHSITPRPFVTVPQSNLTSVHRIFPFQLYARLISPPSHPTIDSNSSTNVRNSYRLSNICTVADPVHEIVALSTSGRLRDVSLWQYQKGADSSMQRLPNAIFTEDWNNSGYVPWSEHVASLASIPRDGILAAQTSSGVSFASFRSDKGGGTGFNWERMVPVEGCIASDLNSISGCDVATLDKFSLKVFDFTVSSRVPASQCDLQPLAPSSSFRWLHYDSHPRTLLLAAPSRLARIDLRCPVQSARPNVLVEPHETWTLPKNDEGISYFASYPSHSFRSILVTGSFLSILDSRMVTTPLLEWNISMSNEPKIGAVSLLEHSRGSNLVLALATPDSGELWVFHACNDRPTLSRGIFASSTNNPACGLPGYPQLFWSDMPLIHMDSFNPGSEKRGLMLLSHPSTNRVSMIQCSTRYGVITQTIGCEQFADGTHAFEPKQNFDLDAIALQDMVSVSHSRASRQTAENGTHVVRGSGFGLSGVEDDGLAVVLPGKYENR